MSDPVPPPDIEIHHIYQVWCNLCGGQIYRAHDQAGADQALADHQAMHDTAAKCEHPLEFRVYGAGDAPAETCTLCGYNFPMNWGEQAHEPMIQASEELVPEPTVTEGA